MNENNTFPLACGLELRLLPVSMAIVNEINSKLFTVLFANKAKATRIKELAGEGGDVSNAEAIELFGDNIGEAARVGDALFKYCAGWGVENDPPGEDTELMELLGAPEGKIHLRRASWVRTLLQDKEAQELVKQIMALTREGVAEDKGEGKGEGKDEDEESGD